MIDEPSSQKLAAFNPASLPPSSLATPTKSPELIPVVVSGQATNVAAEDQTPFAEEFLSPLGSPMNNVPGEAPTSATIAPTHLVDVAEPPESPRSIHSPSQIYHQLWPRINQEMMHLNGVEALKAVDPVVNPIENTTTEPVAHEPLVAEAPLLAAPVTSSISRVGERHWICPASPVSGTKSIVDGYRTPSPMSSSVQESYRITQQLPADDQQEIVTTDEPRRSCLDSVLMGDTNVPDGQIFPPGAEFVKGWHMMNNGELPWPTTTEVQFVAGEMFASECSAALRAKVGVVHPGQDLDIWTGDLKVCAYTYSEGMHLTSVKAPDVPGRYVGYWRLTDGQGNFFGSSVWIE